MNRHGLKYGFLLLLVGMFFISRATVESVCEGVVLQSYDGDNIGDAFLSQFSDLPYISLLGNSYIRFDAKSIGSFNKVNIKLGTYSEASTVYGITHQVVDDDNVRIIWEDTSGTTQWHVLCYREHDWSCCVDTVVDRPTFLLQDIVYDRSYCFQIFDALDSLDIGSDLYCFSVGCADNSICRDFTDLYSCNVVGTTGLFTNPFNVTGIVDYGSGSAYSQHTVHTDTSERDARTNYVLRTVPQGASASVRLGNWRVKAKAESLTYKFKVDTSVSNLLLMRYAVVLQDHLEHTYVDQPRFTFRIIDENGDEFNPSCYSRNYIVSNDSYWHAINDDILWKDWSTVGIDLDELHGQTVRLQLVTYDCKLNDHFGYAYFTFECANKVIKSLSCGDFTENTFIAPSGFNYQWYNEDNPNLILGTSQELYVTEEGVYKCKMTMLDSPEGECETILTAIARNRYPLARFSTEVEGDVCDNHIQFKEQSVVVEDGFHTVLLDDSCEDIWWDFGDGQVSSERNPKHRYDNMGEYEVKMVASLADGQCTDTIQKNIRVGYDCPYQVIYDTCCGNTYYFFDTLITTSGYYVHETDTSCIELYLVMLDNSYAQRIDTVVENQLPYHYVGYTFDTMVTDSIIVIPNKIGCDSVIDYSLMVYYNKDTIIEKNICDSQLPYTWNGYIYDSAGVQYKTLLLDNGADSIVGMKLVVHPTYDIELEDYFCEGYTYMFDSIEYSEVGDYQGAFKTHQYECDSVVTLHLVLHETKNTIEFMRYCKDSSIVWQDGNIYDEPTTTPTVVLKGLDGCDSVVHLTLDTSILVAYCVANPMTVTYENPRVTLVDESIGGVERVWYMPNIESSDEVVEYDFPLMKDSVEVMLVAKDEWKCLDTAKITLHKSAGQLWAPNVFTPDAESNNLFKVMGEDLLDIEVMIFNRHGQLIYQYQGIDEGWDGTTREGVECPQAAYVYKAKYHFRSYPKRTQYKVGTVTLLR